MKKEKPALKKAKLSRDAKRLIGYWRDSIFDGENEQFSPSNVKQFSRKISTADFQRGHCAPERYRNIEQMFERPNKERGGEHPAGSNQRRRNDPSAGGALPVLLCPLQFRRSGLSDSGPSWLEVFWMPALLHADGRLSSADGKMPWISRDVLEPAGSDEFPIIGRTDAISRFAAKNSEESWKSWDAYLAFADKLLKAVAGQRMLNVEIPGYTKCEDVLIVPDRSGSSSMQFLAELYEEILDERISASVVAKLANVNPPRQSAYQTDKHRLARAALRNVGHFTSAYPLSPSQRRAIHRFMELGDAEYLSITGPPGTGKTTVIQSVIASLWVEAAVKGEPRPPVIACTGATNQSVINIIDCFGRGDNEGSSFRWLPSVTSYGLFCSSATKAAEVRHYQLELRDGTGLSSVMEQEDYVARASSHFLECFRRSHEKRVSLDAAVKHLHAQLRAEYISFKKQILASSGVSFLSFVGSLLGGRKPLTYEEFFNSLTGLDIASRHAMFQLATHYWEGRWLLTCSAMLAEKRKERRGLNTRRDAWQMRAMVTPAFVATLGMLPRFFRFNPHYPEPPLDVLICDEAGQIPTELGVACLALAKRALIVGDCLQLEPYWNVQPHTDRSNLHLNKIAKVDDEDAWGDLSKSGALASNGSLMKLALFSETKLEHGEPGVFLADQRRSVPELVSFCNALAYGNRLKAKRTPPPEKLFNPFSFVHVRGESDRSGTSRLNRIEARELLNWLHENEGRLKKFYEAEDICDVVAIITPFAAQNLEIRRLLPKQWKQMTVGTVGGLQGAERPVVLFSTVYDKSHTDDFFFDQNVNMLNVAVSRARDSFIVFCEREIFRRGKGTPSSILAEFLFRDESNELPLAVGHLSIATRTEDQSDGTRRIDTLDEHIETLRQALLDATNEVIIVSGSVSAAAIKRDRLPGLIRDAVLRGVKVSIFTDFDLNRDSTANDWKPLSAEGFQLLEEAGASVTIVARSHVKSIAIDDHTLVEGSFNWLSANRNENNRHQKYEASTFTYGKSAATGIARLKNQMAYSATAVGDLLPGDAEGGEF